MKDKIECLDCQFNYAGECKGFCQMKRGEQKSADKVEPKFKVGDWITNKGHSYLIADIDYEQRRYLFEVGGYTHEQLNWEYIENADNKYHLWTIEDAKDGDVLACNEEILLFKSYSVQGRISLYCWYNGQTTNFHSKGVTDVSITTKDKIYPATKEQRELLFKKMHEAGYTFDFDKKELEKIEQKPAWSEDDEKNLQGIIDEIQANKSSAPSYDINVYDRFLSWLKFLKQRIGG